MNIFAQRLLTVARALRESPRPEKFTMGKVLHDCGTPACAFGHYVSRTDLQDTFRPVLLPWNDGPTYGTYWVTPPDTGRYAAFNSPDVAAHFGITDMEQCELFDGGHGCGGARAALAAAEYIESFVARKFGDVSPAETGDWRAIAQLTGWSPKVREEKAVRS